ncbi:glycoside hydrolase family 43 protein [Melioribacter sp. Ez-97]|uniref:glycoside hydrolase family 43 protein n=1 Tax=Melioribacter sp. Ez-97 TaxID=3423434 RepID=UPI003EDB26F4
MSDTKVNFIFAVLFSVALACGLFAQEAKVYNSFHPGDLWLDNNGIHINAHGGGILFRDGSYYWFGEHKISGRQGNKAQVGVHCYSSTDLYNWKDEGIALSVDTTDENSEITKGCVIERPKVVFNEKTKKYVMWFHLELKGQGYSAARCGVAVSDNVTGPYQYLRSYRPNPNKWPVNATEKDTTIPEGGDTTLLKLSGNERAAAGYYLRRDYPFGQMSRDMTVFVDDDGKAYLIYASEENYTMHIAELSPDYTSFTGKWYRLFPGGHREAPAIFKRNGIYYLITSGCTGWAPNAARFAVAPSLFGPWEEKGNPCIGKESEITFNSQSAFVLPVRNKKDAFIFMADRWKPENPIDGRYVWLPIEFIDDGIRIQWSDEWSLDFFD